MGKIKEFVKEHKDAINRFMVAGLVATAGGLGFVAGKNSAMLGFTLSVSDAMLTGKPIEWVGKSGTKYVLDCKAIRPN